MHTAALGVPIRAAESTLPLAQSGAWSAHHWDTTCVEEQHTSATSLPNVDRQRAPCHIICAASGTGAGNMS